MAAYRRVNDLRSPAGWLHVHRDQLRAQRSVSSMGSLYLSFFYYSLGHDRQNWPCQTTEDYDDWVCLYEQYVCHVFIIVSYSRPVNTLYKY